jgi:hypothetical protein
MLGGLWRQPICEKARAEWGVFAQSNVFFGTANEWPI